ncbi:hypothetical protein [Saccharopolyspora cebuensis]|uniref:Thiopeptide-type bacteriocin biosynthesis domain-containing protein n=1 Tax=Saccharopolyspora cebuensis TaxID=418759 RepID=A0ABV4CIM0_9PSEU
MQTSPNPEATAGEPLAALRTLAALLRAEDPDGRWFFERQDHPEPILAVWSHTTPTARDTAARETAAAHPGVHLAPRPCEADPAALSGTALALAALGSELALELLRDGELSPARQLPFTALHLDRLSDHVAAGQRSAFLFQCWQSWAAPLSPGERVELGAHADRQVDEVLEAVPDQGDEAGTAWRRYAEAVEELAATAAEGTTPWNYLLFDHAHRTHHRMGIGGPVQALTARLLRTAHRTGRGVRTAEPALAHAGGSRP